MKPKIGRPGSTGLWAVYAPSDGGFRNFCYVMYSMLEYFSFSSKLTSLIYTTFLPNFTKQMWGTLFENYIPECKIKIVITSKCEMAIFFLVSLDLVIVKLLLNP